MRKLCSFLLIIAVIFSTYIFIVDYFGNPFFFSLANYEFKNYINSCYQNKLTYADIFYDKNTDKYVGIVEDNTGVKYELFYSPKINYIYDGFYYDTMKIYKLNIRKKCIDVVRQNCLLYGRIDELSIDKIEIDNNFYTIDDISENKININIKVILIGEYENSQFFNDSFIISTALIKYLSNINNIDIYYYNNQKTLKYSFNKECCPFDVKAVENLSREIKQNS